MTLLASLYLLITCALGTVVLAVGAFVLSAWGLAWVVEWKRERDEGTRL